jgi:prefoldin subunit 4
MSSGGGAILEREEENDAEVRREDQENINSFGRLNARLHELRDEKTELKEKMDKLEDASTELMMASGDKVMLNLGNAFFEADEDEATEYCEDKVSKIETMIESLTEEEDGILDEQKKLKALLYGRFGKSINLEDS